MCGIIRGMSILKKILVSAFLLVGIGVVFHFVATRANPADAGGCGAKDGFCALDFSMRMNEIDCVRSGVNPYDVWSGKVVHPLYYPYNRYEETRTESRNQPINAYTPWEYSYMYPIALVRDRGVRWKVYYSLVVVALLFIGGYACCRGAFGGGGAFVGVFAAACVCLTAFAVRDDLSVGNFAVLITALALAMAMCLNRGWDAMAGVCWALILTKPQLGILFGIPLLMARKYRTVVVAGAICAIASIPPAIMCKTSPVSLVLQAPKASVHAFGCCALMPTGLKDLLMESAGMDVSAVMAVAAVAGVILCTLASWRMRRQADWLARFAPCAILAVSWTYQNCHSHCIAAVAILAMALDISRAGNAKRMLLCWCAMLLFAKAGCPASLIAERAATAFGAGNAEALGSFIRQFASLLSVLAVLTWSFSPDPAAMERHPASGV